MRSFINILQIRIFRLKFKWWYSILDVCFPSIDRVCNCPLELVSRQSPYRIYVNVMTLVPRTEIRLRFTLRASMTSCNYTPRKIVYLRMTRTATLSICTQIHSRLSFNTLTNRNAKTCSFVLSRLQTPSNASIIKNPRFIFHVCDAEKKLESEFCIVTCNRFQRTL